MPRAVRSNLLLTVAFAAGAFVSCNDEPPTEDSCPACGSLATGQFEPAGMVKVDGFFGATDTASRRTVSLSASLDAHATAIGVAFGLPEGEVSAQFVDDLLATIAVDLETHLDGELVVDYVPGTCAADSSEGVRAQAQCELQADCEANPNASVEAMSCDGRCEGACAGACAGEQSCAWPFPLADCEGTCVGTCELAEPSTCDGICYGACDDACSSRTEGGDCQGSCAGLCTGTCELRAGGSCVGTCHGTCRVDQDSGQCQDGAECFGDCDGACAGACAGYVLPPALSPDCEASDDCSGQARARAATALHCSAPRLRLGYALDGSLEPDERAAFLERMAQLELHARALLGDHAELQALIRGIVDDEQVFEPSPVEDLADGLDWTAALVEPDELPPCVGPALQEAAELLEKTTERGEQELSDLAALVAFLRADT